VQIDIAARRVEEVDTEHAVTLVLSGGANVRIECPFDIWELGAEPTTFDPGDLPSGRGLWQGLRGRVVEAGIVDEDSGSLRITFSGGVTLQVLPDPAFESWSASWPDGATVVALPGGGLSSWSAQP
jgi:hypothetical protein